MFRIIRNEAGDEKEELTGYWPAEALVLTGEKKKNKHHQHGKQFSYMLRR